ncbi:hypothetical protein EYC80_004789 [Monilinia laxa]|uniref:Uncharacterized protein n=1 Tax=Monilinia laxa TaxID=61186 RepID=A0A5N6KI43_MONLA|nr:hypothetical protein EYC80_004789 [Monilinia laxa]
MGENQRGDGACFFDLPFLWVSSCIVILRKFEFADRDLSFANIYLRTRSNNQTINQTSQTNTSQYARPSNSRKPRWFCL